VSFEATVADFLAETFRLDPVEATDAGMHDHDHRWPDLSEQGRLDHLDALQRWERRFGEVDPAELDRDARADLEVLLGELAARRFHLEVLREDRWDPLSWVYLLGGGLFPLIARGFAPLAVRLESAAGRLEGMPEVVRSATAQLIGLPDRPVSRLHTETAIENLAGVVDLTDEIVAEGEGHADDPAVAALLPRLRAAAGVARDALAELERHLRDVVLPASEGEGRLGPTLFEAKLRHTFRSDAIASSTILLRAEEEYQRVREEMVRLAGELWPTWRPGEPLPAADDDGGAGAAESRMVDGVLEAIGAEHPEAGRLLAYAEAEHARIVAFCREREIIGLPEEPLEIRWTPKFLRAFGGAMLIPPGPLDRGERSFYAITPIPADWPPEMAESWLREDNDRALRLVGIHEGVPGHYLQLAWSNRCPSLVRSVFPSGVFAEGWAVYVTQVMLDLGFDADDPALWLVHWKLYLRAVVNAIIDVRIHAAGMTEEEALALMIDGAFQEEAEAINKYRRARLSSTQLATYFVGSIEMWDIELEARRRAAVAAGDPRGAGAVPVPALVGGIGPTPGFHYRAHLEAVISHGTPPPAVVRALLFEG
jgi:hypothetical protein